jgi:hypothetical protein
MSDAPTDLYVSAVRGHIVSRPGSSVAIGVTRDPQEPSEITWDHELVVKIPEAEHRAFLREYSRAIREGALKVKTRADFESCHQKREAAVKADADKAKAELAKADADKAKTGKKE